MARRMMKPTTPLDLLLYIDSYPQPTAPSAMEAAVGFARLIGGKLSALAVQMNFPLHTHHLANYLIGLADMATEEETKSATACREGLDHFSKVASEAGVLSDVILDKADIFAVADQVTAHVRCRDLCIVPLSGLFDSPIQMAESLVFGSAGLSCCSERARLGCPPPVWGPWCWPGMAAGAPPGPRLTPYLSCG
jgi:hypothetical protein